MKMDLVNYPRKTHGKWMVNNENGFDGKIIWDVIWDIAGCVIMGKIESRSISGVFHWSQTKKLH